MAFVTIAEIICFGWYSRCQSWVFHCQGEHAVAASVSTLWERSAAERLSERFQPCLILAESDESMSNRFPPCLILAETD